MEKARAARAQVRSASPEGKAAVQVTEQGLRLEKRPWSEQGSWAYGMRFTNNGAEEE